MIDSHSHLFEEEFNNDLDDCIKRCKENNVKLLYFGDTPIEDINCNRDIYNKENYFVNREELLITILPK
jgi:Tat protein secretion system quality control protein TatD with DNase activity